MKAQDLIDKLNNSRQLLELFKLLEQYSDQFGYRTGGDPMLCFSTLSSGELRDSVHDFYDFCFFTLDEAIAGFNRILNQSKAKTEWQKPEPFSYEHIKEPRRVGEYWGFTQDFRELIGLNRYCQAFLVADGNNYVSEQFIAHSVLDKNEPDYRLAVTRSILDLSFSTRKQAEDFIEHLNAFVEKWVTIESHDQLFQYLNITKDDGELYRNLHDAALWNQEALEDDLKDAIRIYAVMWGAGIELNDDFAETAKTLEFPFDIREFWYWRDKFRQVQDWYDLCHEMNVNPPQPDRLYQAIAEQIRPETRQFMSVQLVDSETGEPFKHLSFRAGQFHETLTLPFSVEGFKSVIKQINALEEVKPQP